MSLARAFTARKVKPAQDQVGELPKMPRSHSVRDRGVPVLRHQISGPMQLVHTTNMLSYNAPDIHPLRNKASIRSEQDSEAPSTTESTPPTSPEISPVDEVPGGPEHNHLSTYFMVPDKAFTMSKDAPPVPQRSPSHTKQNSYDAIARSRSVSRKSKDSDHSVSTKASFAFSRSSSTSTRASSSSSNSPVYTQKTLPPPLPVSAPPPAAAPANQASFQHRSRKEAHPFGNELAQVTELAEEYGTRVVSTEEREDNQYIKAHGLVKFTANDYLDDVTSLISSFFPEVNHARTATPLWI